MCGADGPPADREVTMTHSTQAVLDSLASMLRAEAEAAHVQYPQYDKFWDGWRVAEINRTVKTKLGTAFRAGDLVLVSPETRTEQVPPRPLHTDFANWPEKTFATAYSRNNKCNTSVPVEWVREVTVTV